MYSDTGVLRWKSEASVGNVKWAFDKKKTLNCLRDMDIHFLNVCDVASGYIAYSTIILCKETKLKQPSQTKIIQLKKYVDCCLTET